MNIFVQMLFDILPIVLILFAFQFLIIRKKLTNMANILFGLLLVWLGISLFLIGLDTALFPIGELMSNQLTSKDFIANNNFLFDYIWVYIFAFLIGFTTTIAEPALLAIAYKAEMLSGGEINKSNLRIAVAVGVAVGITLGVYRIIVDIPLQYFIIPGYILVIMQTFFTPKDIVALAYDSGGVTTSTVTVPIVAALGIGLSNNLAHSNPLIDSFGLIAFASLFPIISVMSYFGIINIFYKK